MLNSSQSQFEHPEQLTELFEWSQNKPNYNFALSNPKFEYWLLLHFGDVSGNISSKACSDRLEQALPDYDKKIKHNYFPDESIIDAIKRAQQRDNPPCKDWPRAPGTTVYRLVKSIINDKEKYSK